MEDLAEDGEYSKSNNGCKNLNNFELLVTKIKSTSMSVRFVAGMTVSMISNFTSISSIKELSFIIPTLLSYPASIWNVLLRKASNLSPQFSLHSWKF